MALKQHEAVFQLLSVNSTYHMVGSQTPPRYTEGEGMVTYVQGNSTGVTDRPDTNASCPGFYDAWTWKAIEWNWFIILRLSLTLAGIMGNSLVILIHYKSQNVRGTDRLIAGLAVADLLCSIFLTPIPTAARLSHNWVGHMYCKLVFSNVFVWIPFIASMYTLCMISLERFFAIVYPFVYRAKITPSRIKYVFIPIWLLAFVFNIGSFVVNSVHPESCECVVEFPNQLGKMFQGIVLFVFEYVIPIGVMLFAHVRTIRELHREARALKNSRMDSSCLTLNLLQARERVLQMLFVVVMTFIICWTPDQLCYLFYSIGVFDDNFLHSPLYMAFLLLAYVNSCANPFIYTARNPEFRHAIKVLFRKAARVQQVFNTSEWIHDRTDEVVNELGNGTVVESRV
ncbi:galanin receptor 2a-like [Diadema antillarum]|uniref:galanin receptor 2a-like n=1 Tax=Diadema antillarum TaxID=105358 RepID=UPI003A843120